MNLIPPNWTKDLKRAVKERDHYLCQLCGNKQTNRTFPVHHIDYNKQNCNIDNLVTLCPHCHSMTTNSDRGYWEYHLKMVVNYYLKDPDYLKDVIEYWGNKESNTIIAI